MLEKIPKTGRFHPVIKSRLNSFMVPSYDNSTKKINVHTVGPERFKKEPLANQTTSEYIGLVSPLWHYVGVCVFGKTV